MEKIRLLHAVNVISGQTGVVKQHLKFYMLVNNLGYDKLVEVIRAGEDGAWHTLAATLPWGRGGWQGILAVGTGGVAPEKCRHLGRAGVRTR